MESRQGTVLTVCLGLFFAMAAWGATRVNLVTEDLTERIQPVRYVEDQRWGVEGSPYLIEAQFSVEAGSTLTVDPGVSVQVKGSFGIRVLGVLRATEASFSGFEAGAWRGIYFGPDAGGSLLDSSRIDGSSLDQAILHGRWVRSGVYVDGCSPTLRDLRIDVPSGNGIELYQSDAVLTGNHVSVGSEGYHAIWMETLDSFPRLAGNSAAGVGVLGVGVPGGNLERSGQWSQPGVEMPYVVRDTLQLNSGVTLMIASGTAVTMPSRAWRVLGNLMVDGTRDAPVRFNGPWAGFYFGGSSSGSRLTHCEINDAGAVDSGIYNGSWRRAGIYVDHASPTFDRVTVQRSGRNGFELHQSSPELTECVISESAGHGLVARTGSRPVVSGTTFVRNGGDEHYAVWMDATSVPVPSDLAFVDNSRNGVQVGGGMMSELTRWLSWGEQAPYVITENVVVGIGVRWEIDPGVVVKLQSSVLRVDGTLDAVGSEMQPIQFSSAKDDLVGGDSNGDGLESEPAPGDWKGIHLTSLSADSELKHVNFRYGGGDSVGIINGAWRHTTLYLEHSDPTIESVNIRDSRGDGIALYESAATIHGCDFVDMGADRYAIRMIAAVAFPDLQGNTGSGQGTIGVALPATAVAVSGRTTRAGEHFFYYPLGDLTLSEGVTWTLDPGVELRFRGSKLSVFGNLLVQGEEELPVRLRSRAGEPAAGDWKGIYLGPTSSGSELNNLEVWHAGGSDLGIYQGRWRQTAMYLDQAQPLVQGLLIAESGHNGIELVASSPTLRNTTLQECRRFALVARDRSRPILENVLFTRNGAMGNYTVWTDPGSVPEPNDIEFVANVKPGVEIVQGTILEETHWENWGEAAPYIVTGVVTVAPEAGLTVASGTVVKFGPTRLMIEGTLFADGSDGRITLTSLADDSIGGDTNGDLAESAAAAGDWQGVYFGPGASKSSVHRCDLRFAGRDSLGIFNGGWRQASIYLNQCHPTLTHNEISDSAGHGVELYSSDAILRHNQIRRVADGRYPLLFGNLDCFPQLIGNEAMENGGYGIGLPAGSLSRSGMWMRGGIGLPYQPLGDLAVPAGFDLALAPGTRLEIAGHKLVIDGSIWCQGTAAQRVIFGGRQIGENFLLWKGVYMGPGSTDSVVDFTEIRDAGASDLGIFDGRWRRASLYLAGMAAEFRHLSIVGGGGNGVELSSAEALIEDSLVAGHARSGIEIRGGAVPRLTNVTIVENGGNGVTSTDGGFAMVNSIVALNGGTGVSMDSDLAFDRGRIQHNLFHGNAGGDAVLWTLLEAGGVGGNLDQDPLFIDPTLEDFRLSDASVAIDGGTGRDPYGLDLLGRIRWFGESVDLGAYEKNAEEPNYGVDLAGREAGATTWTGLGVVDDHNQRIPLDVPVGEERRLELRCEYTGNLPGATRLTTELPAPGWHLEIHLVGVTGETNVTPAWFAEGGYPLGERAPGEVVQFEFRLSPRDDVEVTTEWDSQVTAVSEAGDRDVLLLGISLVQPPRITKQPLAHSVIEGQGVTLAVLAEGMGDLSYQWFYHDQPVSGAISPTLVFSMTTLSQAGDYHVEVSNEDGTVRSDVAFLEVVEEPVVEPAPFVIDLQPGMLIVDEFAEALFSVEVTGEAPFRYQWYRGDLPLCGETDRELRFVSVRVSHQAVYWVEITDALGRRLTSTKDAELIVDPSDLVEDIVFDNNNIAAVQNAPTVATAFVLEEAVWLTQIETYHWNRAQGQGVGTIGLEDENGIFYGPWEATGRCGQGGVVDAYWSVFPDVELAPGTYSIIDSDHETWSHNGESGGSGFALVRGVLSATVPAGETSVAEATGLVGDWRLLGDAEWFAQSGETHSPGVAMQSGSIVHGQRSVMELAVSGPGKLSFAWKVSSEGADPLRFLVDRHGVVSSAFGAWGGSFRVESLALDSVLPPILTVRDLGNGMIEVSWERDDDGWQLETKPGLAGSDWLPAENVNDLDAGRLGIVIIVDSFTEFFRLTR